MRKLHGFAFAALAAVAMNAWAIGEARLNGKVTDASGKPLDGVTITVQSVQGKNIRQTYTTSKKGTYTILVIEGRFPYKFTFEKKGYLPYEETRQLDLAPATNTLNVTLNEGTAANATATPAKTTDGKPDAAAVAYNEGAELANAGKDAEAIAKFEEAVTIKPDLTAGYIALTKLYRRTGQWQKVVDNGNKALEVLGEDGEIHAAMAEAYAKLGNKEKAAEYGAKAPKDPVALFNEAARLINSGKAAQAESLLKQAIEADAEFAPAHYELGMLYAGQSKNAEARVHLQKYIELDPNGKEVATAKEMLNYIK